MSWIEKIVDRLNIDKLHTLIIKDTIGILNNGKFIDYLSEHDFNAKYIENLDELLNKAPDNIIIIIPDELNLPHYLEKKHVIFDAKKLPIEIEPELLEKLSSEEIIKIMEYQLNEDQLVYVTQNNHDEILSNAKKHHHQKQTEQIKAKISSILQNRINSYDDILLLGDLWGQCVYLNFLCNGKIDHSLMSKMDVMVAEAVLNGKLKESFYEPISNFKTVDRIQQYIKNQGHSKFALICFDGMGIAEWYMLQSYLSKNDIKFKYREIFALIPTMTKISRSAIFYNDHTAVYKIKSPNEDKSFRDFFNEYDSGSFKEGNITTPNNLLGLSAIKVVYNLFDNIAHDTNLPPSEKSKDLYLKNIESYLGKSSIIDEIKLLKDNNYHIYFCSDHGTTIAVGNGEKVEKYLIESSSRRGTIVQESNLIHQINAYKYKIPFIKDKVVLLAKNREAFTYKDKVGITHGGITVDELVTPFGSITNDRI